MNFMNKHAVVTGGSNGIGRCIAESFLKEGAAVTVIDIDKQASELLRSRFDNLRFYHGDIAEKTVLEDFVNSIDVPVDFLINNACIGRGGLLSGCSYEDFEYVQRVGVTAPYYLTSRLVKNNLLAASASIVNIASTRAFQSQPDTEAYSAAKGGIVALTHAMAVSLAGKARVNVISPGWIDTSANPLHSEQDKRQHSVGRVGTPKDIAGMVLYLCSDRAGFITGENITIDGGMSKLMVYHNDHGWNLEQGGLMSMKEIIRKRKSIRKYDMAPLDAATLDKVRAQIERLTPLYPNIRFSVEIANKTKGMFGVKAPHYLIFGSEEKDGYLENIGFIGQQMDLFFSESGLGSCWLGSSKPGEDEASALPFVICMAFGKPAEPLHRTLSEFKRKPLAEISEGTDDRLEAARLAPSGINAQNWYFVADNGKIHCYRKKANPLLGFVFNKMNCIDMGIALCHIAQESDGFQFSKETGVSERNGHVYMGTVRSDDD